MPFVPNTPEAHIAFLSCQSNSICRGVSNSGQPCGRTLAPSKNGEPTSGIITVINGQEAFYCNKHKEQAKDVVLRHTASFAKRREMMGRGSMDTLIEKVELLVAGGEDGDETTATTVTSTTRKVKREDDPFVKGLAGRFHVADEVGEDSDSDETIIPPNPPSPPTNFKLETKRPTRPQQPAYNPNKKEKKKISLLRRLLCCFSLDDDDSEDEGYRQHAQEAELRAAAAAVVEDDDGGSRPKRGNKKDAKVAFATVPPTPPLPMLYPDRRSAPGALAKDTPAKGARLVGKGMSPATPADDDDEIQSVIPVAGDKVTQYAFSLIPQHLTPQTILRLQQELAKPFSPKDEAGYIYVFWLTDSPISPFPTPASTPGPRSSQRNADALLKKAVQAESSSTPQHALLKIGRANNVQRRLHEWSTQCGYNLSLVRYYPHVSSSMSSSPAARNKGWLNSQVGRKVPNSHRVEHLIHLELRDVQGSNFIHVCEACGKVHKEWFSVEASRAGLRGVDEVINRWIEYAERTGGPDGAALEDFSPSPSKEQRRRDATPVRTDGESSKGRKKRDTTPNPPATPKKSAPPSDKQRKSPNTAATNQSSAGKLKVKMQDSETDEQSPSRARTPRKHKSPSPRTGASPSGRGRKKGDGPPRTARKKEEDKTYKYDENDDPDWTPEDDDDE